MNDSEKTKAKRRRGRKANTPYSPKTLPQSEYREFVADALSPTMNARLAQEKYAARGYVMSSWSVEKEFSLIRNSHGQPRRGMQLPALGGAASTSASPIIVTVVRVHADGTADASRIAALVSQILSGGGTL